MKTVLNVAVVFMIIVCFFSCGLPTYNPEEQAAKEKAKQDSIANEQKLMNERENNPKEDEKENAGYYAIADHYGFKLIITDFNVDDSQKSFQELSYPQKDEGLIYSYYCINEGKKDVKAFKVIIEFFKSVGDFATVPYLSEEFSKNMWISTGSQTSTFNTESKTIHFNRTDDPPGKIKAHFTDILYSDDSRYKNK